MTGSGGNTGKFECGKCGKIVYLEESPGLPLCPFCDTFLKRCPTPRHWLFQFNPTVYRWFDRIRETRDPEQWLTSQHAKLIHKGDLVAIWCAGQNSGICAIGQITTNPQRKSLSPEQAKYFLNKNDLQKFLEKPIVMVEYSNIALEEPLLLEDCNKDQTLLGMQVLVNPQGTNFRLRTEHWLRILALLKQRDSHATV